MPGYLGLQVEKPDIPGFVREAAQENGLSEKIEFHVSVLVAGNAKVVSDTVATRVNAKAIQRSVGSLFRKYAWEYELTDEYFLHEHLYTQEDIDANGEGDVPPHTRRTIVQKVILPDLPDFYANLNALLAITLPLPVPHITLFAWSDYEPFRLRGIGINSAEDFAQYTKAVLSSHT